MSIYSIFLLIISMIVIPTIVLYLILKFISSKLDFHFELSGILYLSNIYFGLETKDFTLVVTLKKFKIRPIWFRIRFEFTDLNVYFAVKFDNLINIFHKEPVKDKFSHIRKILTS